MKKSFIIYGEPGTAKTNIEFMFGKSNRESEGIFIGNAQGGDILQTPQKIAAYGGRDSYLAFKKTEPLFSIIKDFSFCVDLVEHDDTKMEGLSVNSETGDEIIPYDYNEEIAKEYKSDCSENKRKIVYFGGSRLFSEARHYSKIGGDVIFMDGQFVWGYNLGDIGGEFLHDFGHSYAYLTDTGPLDEISDVQTNARTAVNEDDKIYLFGSNDFDYGNQCKLSYYLRSTLNGGIMGKEGEVYSLVECSYILYQSEHAGWPPTGAGPLTDKLLKPYLQKCFNSYQDKILVPFTPNQEISYYDGGEEWCA